jgi:hypothetical protein
MGITWNEVLAIILLVVLVNVSLVNIGKYRPKEAAPYADFIILILAGLVSFLIGLI